MIGSSALGIGVTMFLRDQFSGPAARIRRSAQRTEAEMLQMQQQRLRYQRNLYAGAALAGFAALRGLGKSVKLGAEFRYEMVGVRAVTGSSVANMKTLSDTAMELGQNTMFLSGEVASGMRFMGMAGMGWQEINKNIVAATNLAGATQSVIGGKGGAADIMTNVMKAFTISADDSMRVADVLTKAVTSSNTNVFDLGEALKYAGATAMDLKVPLEEATAMVMALGNAGMQGSMAGVAMENSMRYLARTVGQFASGKQNKSLEMMGLTAGDFKDAHGNLKSMTDVIGLVKNALESTYGAGENVIKQGILQNMFGVRGKRAGSLLIRNYDEFLKFKDMMVFGSTGESGRVMNMVMESMEGQIKRTRAALQNLSIAFSEGFEPILKVVYRVVEKVAEVLKKIFQTPVLGAALASGIAGFITIATVAAAYAAVVKGIRLYQLNMASSAIAMGSSTVAAYGAMTTAATTFSAAQRAAALGSIAGTGMIGAVGVNKAGALYRQRAGARGRAGNVIPAAVAARYASRFGAPVAGGRAALGLGTRVAAGSLGRIAGFLGGPIGMALAFILPAAIGGLISVIRKNKTASDENTAALNKGNDKANGVISRREHEVEFITNYRAPMDFLRGYGFKGATERGMDSENFKKSLEEFLGIAKIGLTPKTIIINIDGHTYDVDPAKLDMAEIGL